MIDSSLFISPGSLITDNTFGTQSSDVLVGDILDNEIVGLGSNDTIFGLGGDDQLAGGTGRDVIEGGDGNDTIFGGDGSDILTGGAGNDRFGYIASTEFGDRINDFLVGTDVLQIGSLGLTTASLGSSSSIAFKSVVSNLDFSSENSGIFEITGTRLAGTSFEQAEADGKSALSSLSTGTSATKNLVIMYDSAGSVAGTAATTANAAVFFIDDNSDFGNTTSSEITMVAFLENVGLDTLTTDDFI